MPHLPPELERLIFEYAARENRCVIPSLMRVASRVKQWIEPFLYEIIVVDQSSYSPPNHHEWAIHRNSVRHLLLWDPMSNTATWDYLHSCRNVVSLSFLADNLDIHPYSIRGSSWLAFRTQCPPVYQHLTHLELLASSLPFWQIGWFVSLPTLMHLFVLSPMTHINKSVKHIFARCLQIRMMLWCPWRGGFRDENGEPTKDQIQAIELEELEPRLVICRIGYAQFTKQFIAHAEGKWDSETVWKLAEEVIKKRLETGITDYADIVNYTSK